MVDSIFTRKVDVKTSSGARYAQLEPQIKENITYKVLNDKKKHKIPTTFVKAINKLNNFSLAYSNKYSYYVLIIATVICHEKMTDKKNIKHYKQRLGIKTYKPRKGYHATRIPKRVEFLIHDISELYNKSETEISFFLEQEGEKIISLPLLYGKKFASKIDEMIK